MTVCYHLTIPAEIETARALQAARSISLFGSRIFDDGATALVRGDWTDHEAVPGDCLGESTEDGAASVEARAALEVWETAQAAIVEELRAEAEAVTVAVVAAEVEAMEMK